MKNVWHVFTRDLKRILVVPQAWIIVVGLIATPALYAWVNIGAFWNPYKETSNINVAVVNADRGSSSELAGTVNFGKQVVNKLHDNDQLGWQFMNKQQAMESVRSGQSYAVIMIPADFSKNLLSITTSKFTQPNIQYYVNEKSNAIAPKITDTGASTIEAQITSTFTSAVAKSAAESLQEAGVDAKDQLVGARNGALNVLDKASTSIDNAKKSVATLRKNLNNSRSGLRDSSNTLADVDRALRTTQQAISQSQSLAASTQKDIAKFTESATKSYAQGATLLSGVSSQATSSLTSVTSGLTTANSRVGTAINGVDQVVTANGQAISHLQTLLDNANLDSDVANQLESVLKDLKAHNTADQKVLANLKSVNQTLTTSITSLSNATKAIDGSVQDATKASGNIQTILINTIPQLNRDISALSSSSGGLSSAITAQRSQVKQAQQLLASLDNQLASTVSAVGDFGKNLDGMDESISNLHTDVNALSSASIWNDLGVLTDLNPTQIAQFMASPVEVSEQVVFPVASYGSGMAAMFTNLSLWIGSFMLMVVLKLEADKEGIEDLTVSQGYLGRWLLLACIAALQGSLVTIGDLVIGVQHVNAVAFVGTGMLIALAYLSIIYALSLSFSHIGKGICIILVIVQIPGTSGLYPIEMMPTFFQKLYPFFPLTYGIDAMREVISGFYDHHYAQRLGVLAIFVALAFILGLALRRSLGPLKMLFNREIASTDLLIAEDIHTGSSYRLSQVLRSLSHRREYRRFLNHRAEAFNRQYPRLRKGGFIAAILVPIVLVCIPSSSPSAKALLLGVWVGWFLLLFAFFVTIEYIRDSIDNGLKVSGMAEEELRLAMQTNIAPHHLSRHASNSERMPRASASESDPSESDTPDVPRRGDDE